MAVVDGHPYALLVEAVEDVVEASEDPDQQGAALAGRWRRIATATVEAEGDLFLLADIGSLIAGPVGAAAA